MATGSGSRDVTLTLTVDTLGEEGIKQLQTAISSLAGAGTSAGPEFQKLADQITRLGEQNTALQTVKTLAEQTDKLAQDQEAAAQKAQELATRLDALKQSAAAAAQKQIEAKDAVNEAKKANVEYTAEITKLRSEFDAAGKKTDEYKTKFRELTDTQAEAKKKIIDLRDAQKAANTEYGQAQSAVSKLTSEYERESASAAKAVQATNDKRTALNNAAEQAGKLGVVTTDLATAEGNLIAVFNRGVTAVNERKAALVEMAESDRLLAIQEQAQIDLLKRGEQALQAEVLALRDAERSIQAYEAAKAKATADEQAWQREAFAIVEAKEAAQKLAHETEVLTAAQKELAQQKAFEQLANEAKKMSAAAEYVRMWETELAAAEAQEKKTAEAASKIKDAFKDVGVKSVQELEAEIAKTKAAMETLASESTATGTTLKGAFDAGNAKINALERDLRELNGTMTLGDKTAKLFSGALGQIAAGNLVADAVGYLVQKVKDLSVEFFTVNLEAQRLSKALGQVYGDSGLAAKQFAFLRETADN
jgi:myosin heavy subunit